MQDDLIICAQRGDTFAFQAIVERYSDVAWKVARVLLPDRHQMAEDALQEAWLDVWRGLPGYSTTREFRPWLLKVVANRCRMQYRRHVLKTTPLLPEHADRVPALINVEAEALGAELDSDLLTALAKLSEEQRRVLELRLFADLDLTEIALVMNISLGTVKSRLNRALAAIRADIGATGNLGKSAYPNKENNGNAATTAFMTRATIQEETA